MALHIGDLVRTAAESVPLHVAATKKPRQLTFAELESSTAQLVRALASRDIAYGDRVVWWGDTTLDAIALWFALARLGAVVVPMNPGSTPEESTALLDRADPALIVGDEAHAGDVSLAALMADPVRTGVTMPVIDENDPHVIFFTSGSSGRPEGRGVVAPCLDVARDREQVHVAQRRTDGVHVPSIPHGGVVRPHDRLELGRRGGLRRTG